jgi:hypothetical protein
MAGKLYDPSNNRADEQPAKPRSIAYCTLRRIGDFLTLDLWRAEEGLCWDHGLQLLQVL